jgi:hypothetical protein
MSLFSLSFQTVIPFRHSPLFFQTHLFLLHNINETHHPRYVLCYLKVFVTHVTNTDFRLKNIMTSYHDAEGDDQVNKAHHIYHAASFL